MLGDGHVQKRLNGSCRYMVTAGAKNLAYLMYIFFNILLAVYCGIASLNKYEL